MLPTVLRKIVLRFQPGTGQFLVTRPARARWRDSIGGNVSADHRVSCPLQRGSVGERINTFARGTATADVSEQRQLMHGHF